VVSIDVEVSAVPGGDFKPPLTSTRSLAFFDGPGHGLHVLLYHRSDLIQARPGRVSLYLSGHTRRTVRLPWWGRSSLSRNTANSTSGLCRSGRRHYVSRGVGRRTRLPRLRFLCRPVTLIEMGP
jgi:predicted MPP superfamily phosphohydrolase